MNTRIRKTSALLFLPLAFALSACDDDDDPIMIDEPGTIVETAQAGGSFNTLLTALDVAGLTSALEGAGPFTVFAPTNDAFMDLPSGALDYLVSPCHLLEESKILCLA